MRIAPDHEGHPGLMFKEWDNSGVPWTGDWKNPEVPIKIFKSFDFPNNFEVHERIPVTNIKLVKEKWLATADYCRIDLENPRGTSQDRLLHHTALRAHENFWMPLFETEEAFLQESLTTHGAVCESHQGAGTSSLSHGVSEGTHM
jgi:hypothetical protein